MPVTIVGNNTPTAGGVVYGDGTNYASTAAGSAGQILQSNGSSAPSWVAAPNATAANQTEMEAATSNTVFATPSNLKWHPGVAKMWLKCDAAGTINASLNVASISDDGAGEVTVTIDTDFSSSNYSVVATAQSSASNVIRLIYVNTQSAGSFRGICVDQTGGRIDPTNYFFVAFGDQ